MTALTPITGNDTQAFRRGLAAGIAATLVLALSITVGALAAGVVPDVQIAAQPRPAAPAQQVAPAQPLAPPAPAAPKVAPINPDLPIDYYNPVQKGPVLLY